MKGSTRIALRILCFFLLAAGQGQAALATTSSTPTTKDEGEAIASSMEKERDLASRITGGTTARKTRYPFFTYVIAKDVVLTAAHCVVNAVAIEVRVNSTSFASSPYEYNREASSWLIHPNYDRFTLANDIALLFLSLAVDGVPLPKINRKKSEPKAGKSVTAIGLGKIQSSPQVLPTDLMQVSMKTLPAEECNIYNTNVFQDMNHICVGDSKNICQGDSGGPLLLTGKGRPSKDVVVGISSYTGGVSCGEYPSGFTRVSKFASWITEHVCEKSVDPAPFKC